MSKYPFIQQHDEKDCGAACLSMISEYYDVGVKRYFDPMIPTDCYALRAPTILKTFEIRPNRATFECFAGPKVILFHASMKSMTF